MLEEARRHGYYDEYKPELEYSFTLLFYINTLFTYMAGVGSTKYGFVRAMGQEMRRTFPDFMQNPYFFMLYYKLLWAYRRWRKARKND